jgi:hypothetical protein
MVSTGPAGDRQDKWLSVVRFDGTGIESDELADGGSQDDRIRDGDGLGIIVEIRIHPLAMLRLLGEPMGPRIEVSIRIASAVQPARPVNRTYTNGPTIGSAIAEPCLSWRQSATLRLFNSWNVSETYHDGCRNSITCCIRLPLHVRGNARRKSSRRRRSTGKFPGS